VAPGFIDGHSHSDLQVLEGRPEKLHQGVTTEVVGNCGFSPYPAGADRKALYEFANGIFCGGDQWGWKSAREYLEAVARAGNRAVSLVGHGTLRIAVAGSRGGALENRQVEAMERLLDECLAAGACGFSTGLMYAPGESAPREELERLLRVVARRGKVYSTHMRSYGRNLVAAVEEQVALARVTGCRLQISHLQAAGKKNWSLQGPALERIERARHEGVDIAFDCYPYTYGSTVLTQILPQSALAGGNQAMLARLRDPEQRARVVAGTLEQLDHEWSDIIISAVAAPEWKEVVGSNIADLAARRGRPPAETMMDALLENHAAVNILERNQSEENLRRTLTHPLSIVISDGFYVKGRPHPRLYGTFPELLGRTCRELGWMSLPAAVHKITGAPAERFKLAKRGRVARGMTADITVFDPARVQSRATYESPEQRPEGILHVFSGGQELAG
jgi:dihydroorotase/N-acyl-D-amino-acid deacylase